MEDFKTAVQNPSGKSRPSTLVQIKHVCVTCPCPCCCLSLKCSNIQSRVCAYLRASVKPNHQNPPENGKDLPCDVLKAEMKSIVPSQWDEEPLYEQLKQEASSKPKDQQVLEQLSILRLVGLKKDASFTGVDYHGCATIQYQAFGSRLLVMALVEDLLKHFRTTSIQEGVQLLCGLDASSAPDHFSVPSLTMGLIRCGDILYTPMGSVFIEKAINDTSIYYRRGI